MPTVLKDYNVSDKPEDHVIVGFSSSGIAAFEAAWFKDDIFGKVYTGSPTFVNIRGGSIRGSAIRMSDRKNLKIFTTGGKHDLDNVFGSRRAGRTEVIIYGPKKVTYA